MDTGTTGMATSTTAPLKGREVVPHAPLSPKGRKKVVVPHHAPLSGSYTDLLNDDLDPPLLSRRHSAGSCSGGQASCQSGGLASLTGEWSVFSFDGNADDEDCSWNNDDDDDGAGGGGGGRLDVDEKHEDEDGGGCDANFAEVALSGLAEFAAASESAGGAGAGRRIFPRQRRRLSCPTMGGTMDLPVSIVAALPRDELERSERLFDERLIDPFGDVGKALDTATRRDELLATGASTKRSRTADPEGRTAPGGGGGDRGFVRAKRRMSCPSIGIGDHLGSFEPEPIPLVLPSSSQQQQQQQQQGQSRLGINNNFGHNPFSHAASGYHSQPPPVASPSTRLMTEQSRFILNNMLLRPTNNHGPAGGTTNVEQQQQQLDHRVAEQLAPAPAPAGAAAAMSREGMMRYALSVLSKRNLVGGRPEADDAAVMQQRFLDGSTRQMQIQMAGRGGADGVGTGADVDGTRNANDQQSKWKGEAGPAVKGRNRRKDIFPQKLMKLLDDEKHHDVVIWLPDGEAFVVLKRQEFVRTVLPGFFAKKEGTKYESFTRKLNRWGFERLIAREREKSERVYCHKYFKRDDPDLCLQMRTKDELDRMSTKEQSDYVNNDPTSESRGTTHVQADLECSNIPVVSSSGMACQVKPFGGTDCRSPAHGGAMFNGTPGMMDSSLRLQQQLQLTGAPSCLVQPPPVHGNASPCLNGATSSLGIRSHQLNQDTNCRMVDFSGGANMPPPLVGSAMGNAGQERKPPT